MNTYKNTMKLWVLALLVSTFGIAQTSNTGVLHVNPGTIFSSVAEFDNQAAATFTNNGESYFYAHFNNDGTVGFGAAGERLTRFEAPYGNNPTVPQELKGANLTHLYDVQFNNDAALVPAYELHSQLSVANEADFNEGVLQNDVHGGLLIFEDEATAINLSNDSHVNGKVQKKGDDAFTYPISDVKGDKGYYRHAAISAPTNVDHDFTAKYFFESPIGKTAEGHTPTAATATEIGTLNKAEFWTVIRGNGTGHVVLTLSYDAATTPANVMAAPQKDNMVVAYWNDADKEWKNLGGVVDETAQTVTTVANLSGYGIFTLARSSKSRKTSDLVVFNAVSNNGDGKNDFLNIQGLPTKNNVKIFNRWGVMVYETDDYNTNGNVFKGLSNGRATMQSNEKLPTGTYFYIISYPEGNGQKEHSGYLYLTTE